MATAELIQFNARSKTPFDKAEYISALHVWIESHDVSETLSPDEIGKLSAFARLDAQRKALILHSSRYYQTHKTADVAPGVMTVITLLSDNDNGVASVSEPVLAAMFGRSVSAIHEARKRLKDASMIGTTLGRYAGSYPIIPRAIADSYNHLAWLLEATKTFNHSVSQGDCQSHGQTRGLSQSHGQTRGLNGVNHSVGDTSITRPDAGLLLLETSSDTQCLNNSNCSHDENSDDRLRIAAAVLAIALAAGPQLGAVAAPLAPPPPAIHSEASEPAKKEKPVKAEKTRMPADWFLPQSWGQWSTHNCRRDADWVRGQASKFKEYWLSVPDAKAFKVDWKKTWQNWCKNALEREAKYNEGRPYAPKRSSAYGRGDDRSPETAEELLAQTAHFYEGVIV